MADTTNPPGGNGPAGTPQPANGQPASAGEANQAAQQAQPPSIGVLTQYVKDLSFENPRAPMSLASQSGSPKIEIGVNVNANSMGNDLFEVVLSVEAKAQPQEGAQQNAAGEAGAGSGVLFAVELTYAGVFRIQNVPQESMHALVLIECPRLLFPFARQILAEATRNGGFPPLLVDPIDFAALYRQRLARAGQAQPAQSA